MVSLIWLACAAPEVRLHVEHRGCQFDVDGTCIADEELQLWIPAALDDVTVKGASSVRLDTNESGGTHAVLSEPRGEVVVRAGRGVWRLTVDPERPRDPMRSKMDMARSIAAEEPTRAASTYREALTLATPADHRDAQFGRARLHYIEVFELGHPMPETAPLEVSPPGPDGDLAFFERWTLAVWASETGRYRQALRHLSSAKVLDDRFGGERRWQLDQITADIHERLGDRQGALEVLQPHLRPADPCQTVYTSLARWDLELTLHEDGLGPLSPVQMVQGTEDTVQALTSARAHGCPLLSHLAADVYTDAARAAMLVGDADRARAHLSKVDLATARDTTRTFVDILRLAISGDAVQGSTEPRRHSTASDQLRLRRARARALHRLGTPNKALDAYEQLIDDTLRLGPLVPLEQGRAGFYGWCESLVDAAVPLLVAQGRLEDAWSLIARTRQAYVAHLRGPDLAEDTGWRHAREQLGTLWRRRRDHIAALADAPADEMSTLHDKIQRLDTEMAELADSALTDITPTPYTGEGLQLTSLRADNGLLYLLRKGEHIEASSNLHTLAAQFRGQTLRIPHAQVQPWLQNARVDGERLDEIAQTVWSLGGQASALPEIRRALVVADPNGTLWSARAEAEEAATTLRARGVEVVWLSGADATMTRVHQHLREVDLFHFSGHASYGDGPWDARLELADGWLDARSVLALDRVPSIAVLAGCETLRSSERGVSDLGIAQAFVLRGSAAVVGTSEEVDSATARAVSTAFHEALVDRTPIAAFHAVRQSDIDTSAFQILIP